MRRLIYPESGRIHLDIRRGIIRFKNSYPRMRPIPSFTTIASLQMTSGANCPTNSCSRKCSRVKFQCSLNPCWRESNYSKSPCLNCSKYLFWKNLWTPLIRSSETSSFSKPSLLWSPSRTWRTCTISSTSLSYSWLRIVRISKLRKTPKSTSR